MWRKHLPLLLIIVLAAILRFVFLGSVPAGITYDELDYVINAKALYLNQTDISGTWNPLSLKTPPFEYPKGETGYHIFAPVVGPLEFSLLTARLTNAIGGVILVVLIYLITKKLIGAKEAVVAGIFMAINPWGIFFSRTAYDTPLSVVFYFAALCVILYAKNWKILLTIPLLFFAFFGYVGTKIILIPFTVVATFYANFWMTQKKYQRFYLAVIFSALVFFSFFIANAFTTTDKTRTTDLLTPFSSVVEEEVLLRRQASLLSPFTPLINNKLTVFTGILLTKYLSAFSPDLLFLNGEQTAFYFFRQHGFFYALDALFLLLGLFILWQKKRSVGVFLCLLALVAAMPAALSSVGTSYAIRAAMLFPLLVIFISVGASSLVYHKKYGRILTILFIFVYTFFTLIFFHNYLYEQPLYGSEKVNLSSRILAKYIALSKAETDTIYFVKTTPQDTLISSYFFKPYLFYNNLLTDENSQKLAETISSNKNSYAGLTLIDCSKLVNTTNSTVVFPEGACEDMPKGEKITLARLTDGGTIYEIYGDKLCRDYSLKRYPENIKLEDLRIESLSKQEFCETFLTELK